MQTSQPVVRIISVAALVDWNAQLRLSGHDAEVRPEQAAEVAFRQTTRRIARCLADLGAELRFRVSLRLYHGWHKGYEPTANRKAAQRVIARTDFAALSQRANVVFSPNVGFGDRLVHALDRRLHTRLGIHLPNTLRTRYGDELEEKMVDTALAADIVSIAFMDPADWILVVTEDDDLVPPVYVAESLRAGSDSKVVMLRKNSRTSLLLLDELIVNG